jgi:general secretion pathway protein J
MKTPIMKRRRSEPARRVAGFTLLELMVAIAVFAVMATAAYSGLDSALTTEAKLDDEGRKWKNLTILMNHLERELSCFLDRPVTAADGSNLRSITGPDLTFTRTGNGAEGRAPRRVGYKLNSGKLEENVWPVLDAAPGAKPDVYQIMDGVKFFGVRFGASGGWSQTWDNESPPRAVEVTIKLDSGEAMTRMFVLR